MLIDRLVRWWIEKNPAYVLSALLMLAGCYLVLEPWDPAARSPTGTWGAFALVQVYEAGLLAAAALLVRRRGPAVEGMVVAGTAALFLGDCLFLGHAFQGAALAVRPAGAVAIALAGIAKLRALEWALEVRIPLSTKAFVLASIAVFEALPLAIRVSVLADGSPRRWIEAAGWVLALLGAGALRLASGPGPHEASRRIGPVLEAAFAALGPVHVLGGAIVGGVPVAPSILAPFACAAAWVVLSRWRAPLADGVAAVLLVAAIASLASSPAVDAWTPFRSGLAATALVGAAAWLVRGRSARWGGVALAAVVVLAAGPTPVAASMELRSVAAGIPSLLPRTSRGWGAVAIAGAFASLGLGLGTTMWRDAPDRPRRRPPPADG